MKLDDSALVSLVVVSTEGFDGLEASLESAIAELKSRYAFFEVLVIGAPAGDAVLTLVSRLGKSVPQLRVLELEGQPDFDRMAMQGYQECIGDLIVVSSSDEIGHINLESIVGRLRGGEELVRLEPRRLCRRPFVLSYAAMAG